MLSATARGPERRPNKDDGSLPSRLLSVVFQYLIAGRGQFGPILLQTSQDGEVTLIDHRPAVALDVARTGRLLFRRATALLLLGESAG
jgi:hypothetical protein